MFACCAQTLVCTIKSIGQSFSALCTSSLEYLSAISSSHSLSEAMLFLSLTFLGLVSSEHCLHLLDYYTEAFRRLAFLRFFTQ